MLIRSLNVAKYGVCRNTKISDINDDLVVVYGPNEAGKTTCMEFIRGVFYGLANDGREKYVRGNAEDVFGGSISIESGDGQSWAISRELANHEGNPKESVDILIGGQLHSVATMNRELLKGVDHEIFRNVFTVGLDELQHLNTLNATEAAEFLYEMTTGMDRVSLGEVLRGVTQTRRSIFDRNYVGSEVSLMEKRVEQLEELIHNDFRQLEAWSHLRNELRSGKQDIQRLVAESHAIQRSVHLLEIATRTRDVWIQRREARKQLEQLPHLSERLAEIADAESVLRLREVDAERVSLNEEIQELKEEGSAIKIQIQSVPVNTDVAANVVRIHAICEHAGWLLSLQDQVAALKKDVAELSNESAFELSSGLLERITGPMPEVDSHVLRAVSQSEDELTFADERRAEQVVLIDQIQADLGEVEQEWTNLIVANAPQLIVDSGQRVVSSNVGFDEIGFETLLAEVGSDIGVLRTRLDLEDQQARLQREIDALEGCITNNIGGLPSGKVLVSSAGLTIVGFVAAAVGLIFAEVFSLGAVAATMIGILGVASFAAGIGYRVFDSLRSKQQAAAEASRQSLLSRQHVKCHADIKAIESNNVLSGASWDIQLRDLQEQHSLLESMVPVLGKLKTVNARGQLARTRLADCQRNAEDAQKLWASVLVEQGLPAELRPSDVHAIADNSDVIAQRKRRLDDRKAELTRREADLADLVNRIDQIFIDLNTQPESTEAAVQIRQLSRLLNQQHEAKQQRKRLKKSARKLKKQRNKIIAKRQALETSQNRVFVRAGVSDLAELEQLSQSHCGALELRSQCDDASDVILQQLTDKEFGENELDSIFNEHDSSEIVGEIQRLRDQLHESSELLASLYEEQGQKKQELQQLLDDPNLDSAKLELTVVRQQLSDAQRRWRVWAVTEYVLQQVRDVYESERQPETLVDAGQWLSKISDGKYVRIWTPLDEDALYVDDSSGQTWGVDTLSRGTRESVFICLRLALVNSYTKRGVRLPLILDDVLVNCDSNRAKHGVAMLRDFAEQGTQVFFFTCHSHLTEHFDSANADVRELALRDDVVAPDIPRFSSATTEFMKDATTVDPLPLATSGVQSAIENDSGMSENDGENEIEDQLSGESIELGHEQEVTDLGAIKIPKEVAEEEVAEEEVAEEEVAEEEVAEEEVAEEEVQDDEVLSTEQEIEGVDRLVEAVAVEMDQIDGDVNSSVAVNDPSPSNTDIGELVERALEESRLQDNDDEYDEIEIVDEGDCEIEIVGSDELADEAADWYAEDWDEDDIEDTDGLAA